MAHALSAAAELASDRVQAGHWSGQDVSIADVLVQLRNFEMSLRHDEFAGGHDHPHPRGAAFNLVIVGEGEETGRRCAAITKAISAHHPCRVVIILHDVEHGAGKRLRAQVDCHAHNLLEGALIQHECVTLEVPDEAGHQLQSLVEPLRIPDVRTYLWWTGDVPLTEDGFRSGARWADSVILDSAAFARSPQSFLELARLARSEVLSGLGDFQWFRLDAWRELVAQCFNPLRRRPFLAGIESVRFRYNGDDNCGGATMMAGWLQTRLAWTPSGVARSGQNLTLRFDSPAGRPIEILLQPEDMPDRLPGEVLGARVRAIAGGRSIVMEAELEGSAHDQLATSLELNGQTLRQVRPNQSLTEGRLLLNALLARAREPVHLEVLEAAAALLEATR